MEVPRVRQFFVTGADPGMYVEHWSTTDSPRGRIIFVHGGGHTGVCWTQPPGGHEGWVSYLTNQGWDAYVLDWPGTGRSGYTPDLVSMGAAPVVDAVAQLLSSLGPSCLIGHSIGGTICVKAAERHPELVTSIVAAMPGPMGNIPCETPAADESALIVTSRVRASAFFTSSERFPIEHFDEYYASRVPLSPRIYNQLGARTGTDLLVADVDAVRRIPALVVAAEGDDLVTQAESESFAEFLGGEYCLLGRDLGMEGFGHMAVLERDNTEIAQRVAQWLDTHTMSVPGTVAL